MPQDTGGLRSGSTGLTHPSHLFRKIGHSGSHRQLLQRGIPRILGGDSGGPDVPHHFQCGCGRSVAPLGLTGGREQRRSGRVGYGCAMLNHILLCR